ncbi:MAG: WXG100 family type VII secretion target [Mycobacterium sp.]|nr:WXG100 family type VII secretion target [Mycobacterium sp.]
MADAYSVDPEALSDALERMTRFQQLSAALLQEIDSVVKNLHISWEGEGAAAHAQAHARWKHGATVMDEALKSLHRSGTDAHHNYTEAMKANQKMWS